MIKCTKRPSLNSPLQSPIRGIARPLPFWHHQTMTTISEIPTLSLADLRPIAQRALQLSEWPGDWPAAGLIFHQCEVQTSRMPAPPHTYTAIIMGLGIAGGIATGIDADPLVAIFRAFILWKAQEKNIVNPTLPAIC